MRIIQLHSENVKRIKAIDITPDDDVIVLSGKNGAGKTSVLDSIWLAIQYKAAKKHTPEPLRAGTNKGLVTVDLGDYIVTRKFTQAGTTLEVRTPEGSKITSPQRLLDGLIGDLSFDPWEFSRKSEKDQREMLADVLFAISKGKLDLAGFDAQHKAAFEKRTEVNRDHQRLASAITQMAPPTAADPTEEIAIKDLTTAIGEGIKVKTTTQALVQNEKRLCEQIVKMEAELQALKQEQQTVVRTLKDLPEAPDIEFLQGELSNIEQRNTRARQVKQYHDTRAALTSVNAEIEGYNNTMDLLSIKKAEALENSALPVEGLKLTADGLMVTTSDNKLVPFAQASAAQRLKISLGIAMAANPTLRVIRIADGSLLDDDSMAIIKDMSDNHDYQCWIEYASRNDQDRMGVYIEDGSVAKINTNA